MSWLHRWVDFWSAKEHPRTIALVRILLSLTILYDFLEIWAHGLVLPLFADQSQGGWIPLAERDTLPMLYQLLPMEAWVGQMHWAWIVGLAVCLCVGFMSRTCTIGLLILWAQFTAVDPAADRAIDVLCRNALLIFALSGWGKTWSVDAYLQTRRFSPANVEVGSWPRYLLIAQLVVMYFTAGVQKVGFYWMPWGHFAALYVILQDPAIARFDFTYLAKQPFFLSTQIGTFVTMAWQWCYPLVFVWYWFKNTADRPGRLRAFSNRWHLHLVWMFVGGIFHLLLAVTMELGIFPWAMLALYPAFFDPEELKDALDWVRRRVLRR